MLMEPVELLRDWYSRMNDGDIAGATAQLDPAIEWTEAEHSPYGPPGQRLVGVAAVADAVWSKLARDWSELRVVPHEYIAAPGVVVVIGRYVGRHRGSGAELDAQAVHVWNVRDGKVTGYRGFADTYALHAAIADGAPLPSGPSGPVANAEQNKAAAGLVFAVWNGGDHGLLDQVVAPEVIHHDPYDPHAADGLAGMKATIRRQRDVFPDLHITIDDQVAEDERVATRWTAAMTHRGSLTGEPPTGRAVTIAGITIDRFDDGTIVEAWRSMDTLHLLTAIGVVTRAGS
jgi:steroid delta-isomerase-like uncharacterized protein